MDNSLVVSGVGPIVSAMTATVNRLTTPPRKLADMNKSTLSARTLTARKRAGFKSQEAAAKAIGCSRGTVAMWETSGSLSIGKYLLEAARTYRVRPEWLDTGAGDDGYPWEPDGRKVKVHAYDVRGVDAQDAIDPETEAFVDEVDVQLSGGPGTIIPEYVETRYRMPFQIEWLRKFGAKPENVKLMRVNGDSMERTLFDGDRVAVHLADKRIVDGRIFALIAGDAKIKRLFRLRDGALRIVSDNENKGLFPDEIVPADDMESVYIIGRVIDKSGAGGL